MPQIVTFQYPAFHPHDTIHRLIYPSPDPVTPSVITSTISRQLEAWRADPHHITWLIIRDPETKIRDQNNGDGEEKERIVAAAKWIVWPPTASGPIEASGKEKKKKRWPDKIPVNWVSPSPDPNTPNIGGGVDDIEYVSWVMEEFHSRRRARIQGPAVLLDACFTDPEYHRRGAGKMLMRWGTERADELGVRAFVEASPMGKRLYESCGFEVREHVVLEGGRERDEWKGYGVAEYYFMEREIRGKSDEN